MNKEKIRDISSWGLEVGSHSTAHDYLSGLTDEEMEIGLYDLKSKLCELLYISVNNNISNNAIVVKLIKQDYFHRKSAAIPRSIIYRTG